MSDPVSAEQRPWRRSSSSRSRPGRSASRKLDALLGFRSKVATKVGETLKGPFAAVSKPIFTNVGRVLGVLKSSQTIRVSNKLERTSHSARRIRRKFLRTWRSSKRRRPPPVAANRLRLRGEQLFRQRVGEALSFGERISGGKLAFGNRARQFRRILLLRSRCPALQKRVERAPQND